MIIGLHGWLLFVLAALHEAAEVAIILKQNPLFCIIRRLYFRWQNDTWYHWLREIIKAQF